MGKYFCQESWLKMPTYWKPQEGIYTEIDVRGSTSLYCEGGEDCCLAARSLFYEEQHHSSSTKKINQQKTLSQYFHQKVWKQRVPGGGRRLLSRFRLQWDFGIQSGLSVMLIFYVTQIYLTLKYLDFLWNSNNVRLRLQWYLEGILCGLLIFYETQISCSLAHFNV